MQRLRPLQFVYPPFDFLEDERVQDELIDGGVRDLMLVWAHLFDDRPSPEAPPYAGRTQGRFVRDYFATERRGSIVPAAFRATPELYAGFGATPPELLLSTPLLCESSPLPRHLRCHPAKFVWPRSC